MKSVIIAIFGSYLSLVVLIYVFQRNMMYAPARDMLSPRAAGVAEMSIHRPTTADGLQITSWFAQPRSNDGPVVVFLHGNAGNIADRAFKARYFLDAGYGVLLVGYRGYADNPGNPTEAGLYADARAALGFLTKQGVAPQNWVFYGESLGSGIAVQMALETEIGKLTGKPETPRAIILEAPFTSMGEAAAYHYPWLPAKLLVRDPYQNDQKINSLHSPLMIFHGEYDQTIPQSQGKALFQMASEPKEAIWIDGAGHNDLYEFGVAPVLIDWINQALR